jgi:hypothetical protein
MYEHRCTKPSAGLYLCILRPNAEYAWRSNSRIDARKRSCRIVAISTQIFQVLPVKEGIPLDQITNNVIMSSYAQLHARLLALPRPSYDQERYGPISTRISKTKGPLDHPLSSNLRARQWNAPSCLLPFPLNPHIDYIRFFEGITTRRRSRNMMDCITNISSVFDTLL